MGVFTHEHVRVEFEDRVLAHVQHVILNKLRRGESFAFTWTDEAGTGPGRTSVWVHAGACVVFEFSDSASPELNRQWLEQLTVTANSPAGLAVIPEPNADAAAAPTHAVRTRGPDRTARSAAHR